MRNPRVLLPIAVLLLIPANLRAATHDVQLTHSEIHQHHLASTRIAYRNDLSVHHFAQTATTVEPATIHPTVLTCLYSLLRRFLGL